MAGAIKRFGVRTALRDIHFLKRVPDFSFPKSSLGKGETGMIVLNEWPLSGARIAAGVSNCGGTDRLLSGRRVAVADIGQLPPFPKRIVDRELMQHCKRGDDDRWPG
jgi:hypothetical protein